MYIMPHEISIACEIVVCIFTACLIGYGLNKVWLINELRFIDDYAYHAFTLILMVTTGQFVTTLMRIISGNHMDNIWWDRLITIGQSLALFTVIIYCLANCSGPCDTKDYRNGGK